MRRCSKDWMFKLVSRWEYGRFHKPGTLLVKIFWIDSILLIRYLWWGDQTGLQYSSIGRTYVIYAFNRSIQFRDTKHLSISLALTMALCIYLIIFINLFLSQHIWPRNNGHVSKKCLFVDITWPSMSDYSLKVSKDSNEPPKILSLIMLPTRNCFLI